MDGVEIAGFDDLLRAARAQPEPQRLLFVFARAALPEDCTPAQRARFEAGQGGALEPVVSVDKDPGALGSFAALAEEASEFAPGWGVVFVAGLAGHDGRAPSSEAAEHALARMVESIRQGRFRAYLPFDRQGEAVQFE